MQKNPPPLSPLVELLKRNPDALTADGLEDALTGFLERPGRPTVGVYDYRECCKCLMRDSDMDMDEAVEWMEFNVVRAVMGPDTPVFVHNDVIP